MAAPKKKDGDKGGPRGFMKAFEAKRKQNQDFLSTKYGEERTLYVGDPAVDWAQGGYSRGGVNLFYGPTKSGKSTLALKLAAIEQKLVSDKTGVPHWVIIYDSEGAHDMENPATFARWELLGLDTEHTLAVSSNEVDVLFGDIGKLEGDLKATRDATLEGKDAVKKLKDDALHVAAIVVDSWGGIQSEQAKDKINAGNISGAANQYGGNAKTINPLIQTILRLGATYGITTFHVQHCIENMDKDPRTGAYRGPKWILLGGQKLRYLSHAITFLEGVEGKDSFIDANGNLVSESEGVATGKKIRIRCEKSRRQVEGRKSETWVDFTTCKFARKSITLFNLASSIGVLVHPVNPDTGKTNNMWWQVEGTDKKFHGQAGTIAALETDEELYNLVWKKSLESKTSDAIGVDLGDLEKLPDEESSDETVG